MIESWQHFQKIKITYKLLQTLDMLPYRTLEPTKTKQEITSPSHTASFQEDFREILSAEEQEQSESTGQHGGTKRFKALFLLIKLTVKQNSQAFPSPSWFPLHTQKHTKQRSPTEKNETALSTMRHDEGRSLKYVRIQG